MKKLLVVMMILICSGAVNGFALSPPWYGLQRKLSSSYGAGPLVDVGQVYESDDGTLVIDINCASRSIAEILSHLLTREWDFNGVHTIVRILDQTGTPVETDGSGFDTLTQEQIKEILLAVFDQNPLFTGTIYESSDGAYLTIEIMPEVIQYYNDNIGDPYGNDNWVAAGVFADVSSDFLGGRVVWFSSGLRDTEHIGHHAGIIPVAASTPGRFGSWWSTDVWIYYRVPGSIRLWFNPANQDNSSRPEINLELPVGQTVLHLTDIVQNTFAEHGIGSIRYSADPRIKVFSRTWTTSPDGGCYGQSIDGVSLEKVLRTSTSGHRTIRMVADQRAGFRVNLGLVSLSPSPVTVEVSILEDQSLAPGDSRFEVTLKPFSMTQLNDIMARLAPGQRDGLVIEAKVTSQGGTIQAYAVEVNNLTNDSFYHEGYY